MGGKARQQTQRIDERAILFVGTTKGLFVYDGDFEREKWKRTGPHIADTEVHSIVYDHRDQKSVYVATSDGLHRTQDFGRTWQRIGKGLPSEVVTHVEIGHHAEPESLWVGLQPAALAVSRDGGETFKEVEGFRNMPSAKEWWGRDGAEPFVHSIVIHEDSPKVLHAAATVAGVFFTEDSGETWKDCNEGIPASYPDTHEHPEVHRDVYRVVANPAKPDRLYAVAREGVYRTDDSGDSWVDVSEGLSSNRARSLAVSPFKPGTVYVVPLGGGDADAPVVDGDLVVYRTFDGGDSWDRMHEGLPAAMNATMHREAMCMDTLDEEGFYFATSKGALFVSVDDGESWLQIAKGLSPVLSLEIVTEQE